MKYQDKLFYKIVKPLLNFLVFILFHPKVIGRENIPKDGGVVLAGNHTKWLDPVTLCAIVKKRQVHFLAKKELFHGVVGFITREMGSIPVDRKIHDKGALNHAITALKDGLCIGIFPEGTINRTDDIIMPFKIGAVKMSHDAKATLVPFVITGKYHILGKRVRIEFFKPISIQDNLDQMNQELMDTVKKGIIGGTYEKK